MHIEEPQAEIDEEMISIEFLMQIIQELPPPMNNTFVTSKIIVL